MRRDNHAHARAIAGAALLAAVAVGACTSERERATPSTQQAERAPTPTQPAQPSAVDVDKVKEEPSRFYDKQVRVTGEVDQIFSDRAFRLEGTGWAFDDDITVLMKKPMDAAAGGALRTDDELVVIGTVRRFVVADIERDLGWDLSPELEVKLKERPVLVADNVRRIGTPEQEREKTAAAGQTGETVATVTQIVAATDPKALTGRKVELARETVQAVAGKGLWVGPTMNEKVLVIPAMIPKDLVVGDFVSASGTLRESPSDALEMWSLPKDMTGDLDKTIYIEATTIREVTAEGDPRRH